MISRAASSFFAGFQPPTGFDQPEQGLDRVIGNSFVVMCRGGQRRAGESGIGVVVMGREANRTPLIAPDANSQLMTRRKEADGESVVTAQNRVGRRQALFQNLQRPGATDLLEPPANAVDLHQMRFQIELLHHP